MWEENKNEKEKKKQCVCQFYINNYSVTFFISLKSELSFFFVSLQNHSLKQIVEISLQTHKFLKACILRNSFLHNG